MLMRQFLLSAFCFIYAVAGSFFSDGLAISNFVIVWISSCFYIWHAVIASLSLRYFCEIFYRACCAVENAYLVKTGSVLQLLWQYLHCMED